MYKCSELSNVLLSSGLLASLTLLSTSVRTGVAKQMFFIYFFVINA